MSKISLSALRRLHEAATPGPWVWDSYSTLAAPTSQLDDEPDAYQVCYVESMTGDLSTPEGRNNALLIEAMRNALPALLDIAEAVQQAWDAADDAIPLASLGHEGAWAVMQSRAKALRAALDRVEE